MDLKKHTHGILPFQPSLILYSRNVPLSTFKSTKDFFSWETVATLRISPLTGSFGMNGQTQIREKQLPKTVEPKNKFFPFI